MKKKSEYSVNPIEELDLQHQGSLGGQHLVGKYGRNITQGDISGSSQSSNVELTPGREPAEGPDVAMSSPSHERKAQKTHERAPSEGSKQESKGSKQETSSKKHHYK